jgi:hypothetical protein
MLSSSDVRCACCPKGMLDPSFRTEEDRPLYWLARPTGRVYFCGPAHATEWATKETKDHSGEEPEVP